MDIRFPSLFGTTLKTPDVDIDVLLDQFLAEPMDSRMVPGALLLKTLCQERFQAFTKLPDNRRGALSVDALTSSQFSSPVLLCSDIAFWALSRIEGKRFIQRSACCDVLDNGNTLLNNLESAEPRLSTVFLDIERGLTDSFCLLAFETVLCSEYGCEFFPALYRRQPLTTSELEDTLSEHINLRADYLRHFDELQWEHARNLPEDWKKLNCFHLFLLCWVLVNPPLFFMPWESSVLLLGPYSRKANDEIHAARERYEWAIGNCKHEINSLLDRKADKAVLSDAKLRLGVYTRLLRRARMAYYWNPMEAVGKSVAVSYVAAMKQGSSA